MKKIFPVIVFLAVILVSCSSEVVPPAAVAPVPDANQLAWHEREQYAFIHFTTNTFTDMEWGYGDESESVFNPTDFNAEQWAETCRDAGLKGIILTCKHHDGFCLWPTAWTEHSVKNSPWRDGKGDVVREVSDACRKFGLFFGIYLSPWDRNHAGYATPEYITYYRNQLTELLTNYGEISEIWLDGANGGDGYYGGKRETRRIAPDYYDWPGTIEIIRRLAPKAIIFSDAGPDCRWCGNEAGLGGDPNWCAMSLDTIYPGKAGIEGMLTHGDINGNHWTPSEVDVSIRPGWFYHRTEDDRVKQPRRLFEIYLQSVGRNCNLLLNLPPDRRGLINELDVKSLLGWKALRDSVFANNLALKAKPSADNWRGKSKTYAPANATDGNPNTYWATDDDILKASLVVDFNQPKKVSYVAVQEYIALGQRVKSFVIEAREGEGWHTVAEGATIGHKRILQINPVETSAVRLRITDAKACPLISNLEVY